MTELRDATLSDLPMIAKCHRAAFPRALSSAMGETYLRKMLEWYLLSDRAFMFLIRQNDRCVGYCGGLIYDGTHAMGSASSMLQHSFREAIQSFLLRPWLFFHPEFVAKYKLAARNIWKRLLGVGSEQRQRVQPAAPVERYTGLVIIGIDKEYQGQGFGSQLLQEFEQKTRKLQIAKMLLTVLSTNHQAIKSYKRNGWSVTATNGRSTTMEKRIGGKTA